VKVEVTTLVVKVEVTTLVVKVEEVATATTFATKVEVVEKK
jgi:hypothetical protein